MLLQGRKAIVTGASSGIGKAAAERLGVEGAGVCVNYYSEQEQGDAEAVVSAIEQTGAEAFALQADVGDEAAVERMVAEAAKRLGGANFGGFFPACSSGSRRWRSTQLFWLSQVFFSSSSRRLDFACF